MGHYMTNEDSPASARGISPYLSPGTEVGNYRIEAFIDRGGMAFVYEATDLRLGRHVALKVLAPELSRDPEFQQRFLRESRFAASLDHPNIVPIYGAGEVGELLYIAMRFVPSGDLAAVLQKEGRLEPEHAISILTAVASALDSAHAAGLVHRDVKPGNILITGSDGRDPCEHVYLSDFGLTKRASSMSKITASGMFTGTLAYIAPEQIHGRQLDDRTDLYALGCAAYECLTGVAPFVRDDQAALLYAHLSEAPAPLSSHRAELGPADAVLAKSLAKEPDNRYQSGAAFIAALSHALPQLHNSHSPDPAASETTTRPRPPDPGPPNQRQPWAATTAAGLITHAPPTPPRPGNEARADASAAPPGTSRPWPPSSL